MQPAVSYIPYATSYHEQTGDIRNFEQIEEGVLLENERNSEEDESILDQIDELSTYDDSGGGSISTNSLENIWERRQIHP